MSTFPNSFYVLRSTTIEQQVYLSWELSKILWKMKDLSAKERENNPQVITVFVFLVYWKGKSITFCFWITWSCAPFRFSFQSQDFSMVMCISVLKCAWESSSFMHAFRINPLALGTSWRFLVSYGKSCKQNILLED